MPTLTQLTLMTLVVLSLNARADQPTDAPQAARTLLERHDLSGVKGKEVILGTATLPAGGIIGFHTHPGDESAYVLKGALILKIRGQPDRELKPGDSFFIARGTVHSLIAAPGDDGGMAVSTWIIDKGKSVATPAK